MKIENGSAVVVLLQNPREKIFGTLLDLSSAGLHVRGIDLNYFDEWIKAIKNEEPYLPMQDSFYPMWRVERVTLDTGSEGLPSMSEQFEERTGTALAEFS